MTSALALVGFTRLGRALKMADLGPKSLQISGNLRKTHPPHEAADSGYEKNEDSRPELPSRWFTALFWSYWVLHQRPGRNSSRNVSASLRPAFPPCVPPHRAPCVQRGSEVTPTSYTEPVVKTCDGRGVVGGWGGGGCKKCNIFRQLGKQRAARALEPPSECTFVCTATANIWSELALNPCVGLRRPALASVGQCWPVVCSRTRTF